ncbi:DNA cytosine methyltransferase [Micromonospora sp. CB01531]|uniref:DNA cytosine methyltransferase n=1 Tax=Micromonospora sp. CB01531 TaxID=1718947 RepID=UPI000B0F412B|nr:DNA cytosine methyltransferase [Micromonospora sp. CB01531]
MKIAPRLTSVPTGSSAGSRGSGLTAAEFFAGIGLVRLGLESAGFRVAWSNDIERDKRDMYAGHFGEGEDHVLDPHDVAEVKGSDMPAGLDLAWASFPCTDLSLAGWRRGLSGSESSTFWHFTRILDEMGESRPSVVALENVVGFATSHGGEDLATAIRELNRLGYSADVLTLDARRFVPQSRPRMFVVGAMNPPQDEPVPNSELRPDWLQAPFGDPTLRTHRAALPAPPAPLTAGLSSLVEKVSDDLWWDDKRRDAFVSSLSPIQAERLEKLRGQRKVSYRTAYRRTRNGVPVWEIRPDDISGCLRTARGGSSKQALVEAGNGSVRVRWMTALEYARLMGAGDYRMSGTRRNQALFGFGDAVCVPVVSWLAEHYLMPLVRGEMQATAAPQLAVVNG